VNSNLFSGYSFGYLREANVIVGKAVGNTLSAMDGMELGCAVGNI